MGYSSRLNAAEIACGVGVTCAARACDKVKWLALAALSVCAMQAQQLGAAALSESGAAPAPNQRQDAKLAPDQPVDPIALELFVDGIVRDAMASEHIAGVSVAVVQDGRTALLKGYGFASLSPARPVDAVTTLFRIGSVSKTLTWMSLMRQVELGRMKLDAPVNDYLPPQLRIPDADFHRPIRVLDLMSHAAGFDNRDIGRTFAQNPSQVLPLDVYLRTYPPERVREAGTLPTYSNYGVALVGSAISHVAHEPFEALIERDITQPLGMTSTTFREPYPTRADLPEPMSSELAARVSEGFTWSGSGFRSYKFEHVMIVPAGSVSSTAADMSRYMLMQLNDGLFGDVRIYGAQTAQAFRTPIMNVPEGVNGWAHGYQIFRLPGGFTGYGHGGATQLFMSNMVLVPALRLGVFITTNTSTGNPLVSRLPDEIVERFYVAAPPRWEPGDTKLVQQADKYAGAYLSTRRAYSGRQKALGFVIGAASVRVTPDGYLLTGRGAATRRWVPDGAAGHFREVSGSDRLTFEFDGAGRATRWISPSGTAAFERVGPLQSAGAFLGLASLVALTAIASWLRFRVGRNNGMEQTRPERLARAASLTVATLWLIFMGLMVAAASRLSDGLGEWPGPLITLASPTALLAAIGALALVAFLPAIWSRSSTAKPGWDVWARLRHTLVTIIYAGFALLLASWGILVPWG